MHEEHDDLHRIHELKETLLCWTEEAMSKGPDAVNCAELGAVVDMIKDLCEAEKYGREATYYKSVADAMGDAPSDDHTMHHYEFEMREPHRDAIPEDPSKAVKS